MVCSEGSFLPKNRVKLQDNHNVPVNIFGKMQIQWINSGNQALGFTIKFVRNGLRLRESGRKVLWFSPPKFSLSVSERQSRCRVNALSDVEHLGLLVEKETLAARLLVYRLTYNGDVVAFKMGRRQGARRAHISIDT